MILPILMSMLICGAPATLGLVQVASSLVAAPHTQPTEQALQTQQRSSADAKKGKISSIRFTGVHSYPEPLLLASSGLHKGDLVAKDDLQAAADRLVQLGLFSTVNYSFKSRGDDLDLTFALVEAPSLAISFDNIPWYTDGELVDAIRKSVPLFTGRAPQEGPVLDEITVALQKFLIQRDPAITVTHEVVNDPVADEMVQQFRVAGPNLTVNRVELGHPLAAESRVVQALLPALINKPFSRQAIALFLSEHVRPIFLERGHLRARFGIPEVRFTGNPAKPSELINVVVPIEPGPVFRWGGAHWSGNQALTAESLDALLALKPNDIANGNNIAAALARVEDAYGRRGYVDAKLAPQPRFDDPAALVRYEIAVTEGPKYHMGDLVITGLSVAAEKKLRAAWPIPPGDVFDRTEFDALLANLQKRSPEIFGELPIHYDEAGHWLRTNPEHATVDVLLDFK